MESSELAVIGLACNLVGIFFLANSITFQRSRRAVEEFFRKGPGSLAKVRDYALNRMQVFVGFLFLNAGFLLQIAGHWEGVRDHVTTLTFCAAIVVFAVLTYVGGLLYSRRHFKMLLREFFQTHAWSFTEDMSLTKEIGQFLGIPLSPDMTVEDYLHQVRQALGVDPTQLPPGASGAVERNRRMRDISPMTGGR